MPSAMRTSRTFPDSLATNASSPRAAAWASLATRTGSPRAAVSWGPRATWSRPRCAARTTTPSVSTTPGVATPTPSRGRSVWPASSPAISMAAVARRWPVSCCPEPWRRLPLRRVTILRARLTMAPRISPARRSRQTTCLASGTTDTSVAGLPTEPDNVRPASSIIPSSTSSPITLDTVVGVSPLARARSARLIGPTWNSARSSNERFCRRASAGTALRRPSKPVRRRSCRTGPRGLPVPQRGRIHPTGLYIKWPYKLAQCGSAHRGAR